MHYFTMITLTAALLLFTGPSAWAQGDNAEQERAIARIEKLGGKVELDVQRPGKPVIKVDLRQTKVTDADLEILKGFTQLRSLNLHNLGVTDAGMKHLKGLTALEHLSSRTPQSAMPAWNTFTAQVLV